MKPGNKTAVLKFRKQDTVANIKLNIADYFHKTFQSNDKTIQFSGAFTSEYEFEIRSKWEMIFSIKRNAKPASVTGRIIQLDEQWTEIKITRRIKSTFTLFNSILLLAGTILIITSFTESNFKLFYLFAGFFLVFVFGILVIAQNMLLRSAVSDFATKLQLAGQ